MHALHSSLRVPLVFSLVLLASGGAMASHDANHTSHDAIHENTTNMKNSIVETIATWIPFVILFVLIGVALSALGINLFQRRP